MSATTNYDKLRAAIVSGDIAPDARLVEADVSANFGMSRGAVRTALIRLEQDGLVVREPHRGARVRKVSDEEAVEILQARAVLEGLAVRQTAERIDDGRGGPRAGLPRAAQRAARLPATSSAPQMRTRNCTRHCSTSPVTGRRAG